jgi:hypothetical protein
MRFLPPLTVGPRELRCEFDQLVVHERAAHFEAVQHRAAIDLREQIVRQVGDAIRGEGGGDDVPRAAVLRTRIRDGMENDLQGGGKRKVERVGERMRL